MKKGEQYLRFIFTEVRLQRCLWRHGSSYDLKMVLTSPNQRTVLLPLKHLCLFHQERFINISNTLKNMAFNWVIPKLWSYTDIENLFASWKSREVPAWWWKRQESCQFTGFKIVPLEQWSTALQDIWIKQELWTKITLCLLGFAVGVAASGFHFLSSHSVGGLVLQSGIAPFAQFLRMFPIWLQICALTMAQSSAKGGCPPGSLCSLHWS